MKKLAWIIGVTLICCSFLSLHAEEKAKMPVETQKSKDLKTLILIIATDDKPAYRELQKIWEAYMNIDPVHFDAYFIRADQKLSTPYVIKKNEITVKTQDGFAPGILNKSILAIDAMGSRIDDYDYVIRTNLSSFYYYPNLLAFLQKLPRTKCYCGVNLFQTQALGLPPELPVVPFITGAGIIMSTDMAKLLAKNHAQLEKYKAELPDDVFIGLFFERQGVPMMPAQRWDYPTREGWLAHKDSIPDYAYHFRAKYSYDPRSAEDPYADELFTLKELLKKYYSITLSAGS